MSVSETSRILEAIGVGLSLGQPPINNACLPTIYNKLDADARERVRVINGMLDYRLMVQTKIIDRYVRDARRMYNCERAIIERELVKTRKKLPYMVEMPYLEMKYGTKNKSLQQEKFEHCKGYITEPKLNCGVQTERDNKPFCERFFAHHIPRRSRIPAILPPLQSQEDPAEQPLSRAEKLLLTKRMSVSDNCLSNKNNLQRHLLLRKIPLPVEDDAATI